MLSFVWDGNPWALPDEDTFERSFDLGFGSAEVIQQIEVAIGITHQRLSDLSVALVGPDGTRIQLAQTGELSGDLIRATFNDQAVAPIGSGTAPYQGRFAPAGQLSGLAGLRFNRTWTIQVTDSVAGISGTLDYWAVYVNEPPPELAFLRAELREATGPPVPTFIPGDVMGVRALWERRELHTFGTGTPYTVRIAVDGVAMEKELLGTVGTQVTGEVLRGWEATLGMHTVEITLDPENRIWELDETNNTFSFQFEVRDLPRAERLVDITTDSQIDYPHSLVRAGDSFCFLMSEGETAPGARQVWCSDGTQEGTTMIYQSPFVNLAEIKDLTAVGSRLFFTNDTFGQGEELWTSDGTAPGSRLVNPASFDSQPRALTPFQGFLFFTRQNAGQSGRSLWKTDGTVEGTLRLSETLTDAFRLTPVGDTLYFAGNDSLHGTELWKSDGTPEGTQLVADIRTGPQSSSPDQLAWIGDELFFTASTALQGRELWASDGNAARLVADTRPGTDNIGSFLDAVDLGGAAFFQGNYAQGVYDPELWRSDGTAGGTGLFLDIHPTAGSRPDDLTVIGNTLFFSAADATHGRELWATEGTVESTRLVADLRAGVDGSAPQEFVATRGNLVFLANQGSWHFYASDGNDNGTGLVAMLPPIRGKYVDASDSEVQLVGDRLYFFWSDAETGRNLWSVELGEFPWLLPDLYTAGMSLFEAPLQFAWGDDVRLNLAVANDGSPTSLSPASVAAVYLSADPHITTDDILLEGTAAGLLPVPPVGTSFERIYARGDDLQLPAAPPAGLPESGVFYIGIVIDPEDNIVELNEANNANQGLHVDVIPVRIGAPELVHVLTHGFRIPGTSVDTFLTPWQDEYPDLLRELARGTELEYQMEILSPAWDSTTGFLSAFADEILYHVITSLSDLPESGPLAELARWLIVGEEDVSYRHAVDAAHQIFDTIENTPHLQGRQFHLIGHSRGAAVNSLLSKLLSDDGFEVVQYTSLDGYSKDWPVPSGFLGDVSIVQEAAATRKVNYQVELGLNRLAGIIGTMLLDRLGIGVPSEQQQQSITELEERLRILGQGDWKAPPRGEAGFEDRFILGAGFNLSDHLDVHGLYFHSADNAANARYVLDSPLGKALEQPSQGSFRMRAFNGQASPGRSLHGLADGSFEQAGAAWQQAATLAGGETVDEPLIAAWLGVLQDPSVVLQSRWSVGGVVNLVNDGGNWLVELTEGLETHLAQTVQIDPEVSGLTFDLAVIQPRPGALLEVTFAGQVLQSVDLSAAVSTHQISVPLDAVAGRTGSLGVRLLGDVADPAVIRIDNLDIGTPLAIDALLVSPWSALPSDLLTFHVPASEADGGDATEVVFYHESNGTAGLQLGAAGDRRLGSDPGGEDGWSLVMRADALLPGSHAAYAVAQNGSGTVGLPGMATFSVQFGDHGWRNPVNRLDVNADSLVSPVDVLTIINNINSKGARTLPRPSYLTSAPPGFIDPTGDGNISAADALAVINALNGRSAGEGEIGGETGGGGGGGGRPLPALSVVPGTAASRLVGLAESSAYDTTRRTHFSRDDVRAHEQTVPPTASTESRLALPRVAPTSDRANSRSTAWPAAELNSERDELDEFLRSRDHVLTSLSADIFCLWTRHA